MSESDRREGEEIRGDFVDDDERLVPAVVVFVVVACSQRLRRRGSEAGRQLS